MTCVEEQLRDCFTSNLSLVDSSHSTAWLACNNKLSKSELLNDSDASEIGLGLTVSEGHVRFFPCVLLFAFLIRNESPPSGEGGEDVGGTTCIEEQLNVFFISNGSLVGLSRSCNSCNSDWNRLNPDSLSDALVREDSKSLYEIWLLLVNGIVRCL